MHLARHPRLRFAHLPTALERLDRLSEHLGGPTLWMKRDDCTGLAGGGNKTRKLEFLMADALVHEADVVITQGATQSNHTRQTAAACARLGLDCHILLEDRTGFEADEYRLNGNVLLEYLTSATIEHRPGGADMNAEMATVADEFRSRGRIPYVVPGGGSNAIGALGYVNAAMEILQQANNADLKIDAIVHATGSAGTQAGLVAGVVAMNCGIPVLGIGVRAPADVQHANVLKLARQTAEHLGIDAPPSPEDVQVDCNYVGDGYGIPTEGCIEAIRLLARLEGILLDPVYSAKGMAGLIDRIRQGHYTQDQSLVFLHTGGAQALAGYRSLLTS